MPGLVRASEVRNSLIRRRCPCEFHRCQIAGRYKRGAECGVGYAMRDETREQCGNAREFFCPIFAPFMGALEQNVETGCVSIAVC
jgi:hypothetical protein